MFMMPAWEPPPVSSAIIQPSRTVAFGPVTILCPSNAPAETADVVLLRRSGRQRSAPFCCNDEQAIDIQKNGVA